MPVATFPLGPLHTNSYLLHNHTQAVAIDVGGDPAPMLDYLKEHKLTLAAICLTHMHFDHIYGVDELARATGATVYRPAGDDVIKDTEASMGGIWGFPTVTPFDSELLPEGQTTLGGMTCTVLQTPGHTPGGVSLYFSSERLVFTGDALFYRSMGRTDFPGGNQQDLLHSIRERLFKLPGDIVVYPGHGPSSTIGDERQNNPFCGDFVQ